MPPAAPPLVPAPPPPARRSRDFLTDLGFAARTLVRSPVSSATIALTLALVMGTAIAFFSLHHGASLRPQDVQRSEQLVHVYWLDAGVVPQLAAGSSFSAVASHATYSELLQGDEPAQIFTTYVSDGWFSTLRPGLFQGRPFVTADHQVDAAPVAIIGHRFWRRRFGGAPVLGQTVVLGRDKAATIVGILSPGFEYPTLRHEGMDVWLPLRTAQRPPSTVTAVGRLHPGVSPARAEEEVSSRVAAWKQQNPALKANRLRGVIPFDRMNMTTQQDAIYRAFLGALFLLLVGGCNIAALSLARGLARRREHAVRLTVGASAGRLVRQSMLEGGLLALLAATFAAPVAVGWIAFLHRHYWSAVNTNPGFRLAGFNPPTLAVAAAITGAAALFIGLPAALQLRRRGIHSSLKESARTHSGSVGVRRARQALLAVQVALATILVGMAALSAEELRGRLHDKGFDTKDVFYLRAELTLNRLSLEDQRAFKAAALTGLSALPGVKAAGLIYPEPFSRDFEPTTSVTLPALAGAPQTVEVHIRTVGGDVTDVLGIPLLRGRTLGPHDDARAPSVAMIDQSFADQYFAGRDPLGQTLSLPGSSRDGQRVSVTIVGVLGAVRHSPAHRRRLPNLYVSYAQAGRDAAVNFVVRTPRDPAAVLPEMKAVLGKVAPALPVKAAGRYDELIPHALSSLLVQSWVMAGFGLLALLLAGLGLHGTAADLVAARRSELGLRMAIGAAPGRILLQVLGHGVGAVVLGAIAGVALIALARRADKSGQLFPPDYAFDLRWLAGGVAVIVVAALASLFFPARQASRLAPLTALRHE